MRRVTAAAILFIVSGMLAVVASAAAVSDVLDDVASRKSFVLNDASAQSYILKEIVLPFPGVTSTFVTALNDVGQIMGGFADASGNHGFLYDHGRFSKLDVPFAGATGTIPEGINNKEQLIGGYRDANGVARGFFYEKGQFARFDLPFATETDLDAINDFGEIVGVYRDNRGGVHGFLYTQGHFVVIDVPLPPVDMTRAFGLNNRGQIVGQYQLSLPPSSSPLTNPVTRGFLYERGQFRMLDIPEFTGFLHINDKGQFVAQCNGISTCEDFYSLYSGGQFAKITLPESSQPFGINRKNLVGVYRDDATGRSHGFIAGKMSGVSFTPIPSTYSTSSDTGGCPAGFVGKFTFSARLTNNTARPPALFNIALRVTTLTNGNLLQNAQFFDPKLKKYSLSPRGVGATLHIPEEGDFADGFLTAGESVDVPLVICLKTASPFNFFVGLYGFQAGSNF